MQALAIRHITITNSLGLGLSATLEALKQRRSGLSYCDFEDVDLPTYIAKVPTLEHTSIRKDLVAYDSRNNRLAQLGLEQDHFIEAVEAAKKKYGAARIAVFIGTSTSSILQTELAYRQLDAQTGALPKNFHYAETQNAYSVGDFVARYLGLSGPAFVVSSACSSSAKVFANAQRMIAANICDAAVIGGVDSLCLSTLYGFNSLGLVSEQPCRPYDAQRNGISIGEGAGFALLERAIENDDAICLLGTGESSDAYHMSSPHPEGLGAKLAMQQALRHANLSTADLDYINLHGTATKSNDASEGSAVANLFGAQIPCSSTKGWTGHLLGAAGITEAAISWLTIAHSFIPGSLNTQQIDADIGINYQIENKSHQVRYALSNSFGFGGSNCSLILGKCT